MLGKRSLYFKVPRLEGRGFLYSDVISDVTAKKMSADISFNGDFNVGSGMDIKVDGQNFLSIISSGDKKFIKINKMPSGLDSFLPMFVNPTQLSFINGEVIGKWIEIDSAQTKSMMQAAGIVALTNVNGTTVEATTTPPLDVKGIMNAFSDSNVFIVDQTLPSESINGQGTFHYKVRLDKAGFKDFMLAVSKLTNGGQYPAGVNEQSMRSEVDQMFAQLDGSSPGAAKIGLDIYVERFSKMPVKMTLNVDASGSPQLKQSGIDSMTIVADVSYSFPSAANITEPDSYVSLMNLMAKASAAFMSVQQQPTVQVFPTIVPSQSPGSSFTASAGSARNAQRRADLATLLSAVYQYAIDNNGNLPISIPKLAVNFVSAANTCPLIAKPQYEICSLDSSSCSGRVNLAKYLAPTFGTSYMTKMPKDPKALASGFGTSYYMAKLNSNRILVCAPLTENGEATLGVSR